MTLFGLSPFTLAALVAGTTAVLFVLHRLRVRPEVQRVPTLLFWREAVEETQARTLFGRFRHPRTFAFLSLLAALIALALADPVTDGGRAATRHTVVVVDTSSTVTARLEDAEDGRTVWDAVREDALRILDDASLGDRVAVVTSAASGGLVAGFDTPRPVARSATAALVPSEAPGNLLRGLQRAATLLANRSRPSIVFLPGPDGAAWMPDVDRSASTFAIGTDPVPVTWITHDAAEPTDQGLVGVRYRETLEVRVAHRGVAGPRTLEVRRLVDGGEAGEGAVRVPLAFETGADARWVPVPGLVADGARVAIRLGGADGYAGNDALAYRLPDRRARRVYVGPGLPAAARLLVESHPRLLPVEDVRRADLTLVATEGATEVAAAGAHVERAPLGPLRDGAARTSLPRLGAAVRSLRGSADRSNPMQVLLSADAKPLVRFGPGRPGRLQVSADLLAPPTGFIDDPAGAAAMAEIIEWAAGIRPGAVAAPASRVGVLTERTIRSVGGKDGRALARSVDGVVRLDGLAPALSTAIDGGSGAPSLAIHAPGLVPVYDVARQKEMPEMPTAPLRLWEWLALVALGFLLVDAWLHTRGRIP